MEDRRLALPWFRSGDYDEIRRIMSDGHKMANSYEVWLKDAEAESKRAESHGMLVERVMIEPYEFEVWCAANGMDKDGYARELFAAENAAYDSRSRA
ncbi:MAG: hypothetical protein EKK30_17010 [Hyphomicrobium sp.]|nr:MAG: hypothetical protein EKK30_17010 [Hyphomicrobium sp.]